MSEEEKHPGKGLEQNPREPSPKEIYTKAQYIVMQGVMNKWGVPKAGHEEFATWWAPTEDVPNCPRILFRDLTLEAPAVLKAIASGDKVTTKKVVEEFLRYWMKVNSVQKPPDFSGYAPDPIK